MDFLRRLSRGIALVFRDDVGLFKRFPRLGISVAGIALVPALYSLIYLSSVWDPNARTQALAVAIVNQDAGISYQGQQANVGRDLVANLKAGGVFGYRDMADPAAARAAVHSGALTFAIVIPPDFSAQAVPGAQPGAGQVTVILSEGNNFTSAGIARRFAAELGHKVNETLNEKRWTLVLATASGSSESLGKLKDGVAALKAGAEQLKAGSRQYSGAADQLADGFKQAGAGVRTMAAKLPADADLQAFKNGQQQLAAGQRELGKGLEQLEGGAEKLTAGAGRMRDETKNILIVGGKISRGAGEIAAGGAQLTEGLGKARGANTQLAQGAAQLEAAGGKLADGMGALGGGIRTLAAKLPADTQLDAFSAGGHKLADGSARLASGIALLEASLPASVGKLDGSARGLAESVAPKLDVLAPVANNGSAFAPNMVAVALWIGAVMTAYLFNLRLILTEHAGTPKLARGLGKFGVPALVVLLQAFLCLLMVVFGLGIQVPEIGTFALSMGLASLVFLAMVYALLRLFGEAGKLLAVLLLTVQLAAGGGVIPIELSGGFFQAVHAWLPFTWVVQAFRASLFGAYDHAWLQAWGLVMLGGVVALLLASFVGRWKVVPLADYRPGIEV